VNNSKIDLILCDPNVELCEAWIKDFKEWEAVSVHQGPFEEIADKFDALVSPANSFGLMDGGVDAAIISFYGKELQEAVLFDIATYWLGEQPVGTSTVIDIPNHKGKYLLHTPTMRVPKLIWGDVVYTAMLAMLLEANTLWECEFLREDILTVCCPGLGTGCGGVPPEEASRQMALAWKNFQNPPSQINWEYAMKREGEIHAMPFATLTA
jgi:O-acetyl-ADP-ribose deacetylase (regulator of RNase III)